MFRKLFDALHSKLSPWPARLTVLARESERLLEEDGSFCHVLAYRAVDAQRGGAMPLVLVLRDHDGPAPDVRRLKSLLLRGLNVRAGVKLEWADLLVCVDPVRDRAASAARAPESARPPSAVATSSRSGPASASRAGSRAAARPAANATDGLSQTPGGIEVVEHDSDDDAWNQYGPTNIAPLQELPKKR